MVETCETCRYGHEIFIGLECRRHPPNYGGKHVSFSKNGMAFNHEIKWPRVGSSDWCGEYGVEPITHVFSDTGGEHEERKDG